MKNKKQYWFFYDISDEASDVFMIDQVIGFNSVVHHSSDTFRNCIKDAINNGRGVVCGFMLKGGVLRINKLHTFKEIMRIEKLKRL